MCRSLFGTGLTRTIDGHLADVVAAINAARDRLAVDLPSGIDADTGRALGAAVTAQRTVTMGPLKIALASAPGFARAGEVTRADIGIPDTLIAASNVRAGLVEERDLREWLPAIHALDHKGTRGHVVVATGVAELRGAGRLAATAALRAGAGLVTLAGEGELVAPDSVMTRTLRAPGDLAAFLDGKAAVVIGPGLGRGERAERWIGEALASGIPVVLDADALNALAAAPDRIAAAGGPVVITPHPGEAARLLGTTSAAIEADRLAAARALASKTRAVVMLKGARTVVCDGLGDDFCAVNPTGGPALGTAGSGDVLAGVVGALLAQRVSVADAARTAAFVHGRAGETLAESYGARGVVSSDLPRAIAAVIAGLTRRTSAAS